MTIKQSLIWAVKQLKAKKITTASLDAEVLLSFILKKSKEFLYTYPEKKLTIQQTKEFKKLISRRAKFEPVAYLTNHKEFYGLDFYVNKNVLIPRPETELVVEEVLNYSRKIQNIPTKVGIPTFPTLVGMPTASALSLLNNIGVGTKYKIQIADIGTGSGAIIITLAKLLPTICHKPYAIPTKVGIPTSLFKINSGVGISYYATDISKKALMVARKNALQHQVKIKFFQGNLLWPLKDKKLDVIVANLPYLRNPLPNEIKLALAGGKDGIKLLEKFFQQLADYNLKPKLIVLEIGYNQKMKLKKLSKIYLPSSKFEFKKDLCGFDRILVLKN